MVHELRIRRLSNRESGARLLRSLSSLYVSGESQWLVCCNGRDLAEGAARSNIDWKAEVSGHRRSNSSPAIFSACLRASVSARLHGQCFAAKTGTRRSRKWRSKSALAAKNDTRGRPPKRGAEAVRHRATLPASTGQCPGARINRNRERDCQESLPIRLPPKCKRPPQRGMEHPVHYATRAAPSPRAGVRVILGAAGCTPLA